MISICCVCFATLDEICDELNDWNLDLLQLFDKCVYVYCVESLAHIKCYSDCSHRGTHLVEPLCYSVVLHACLVCLLLCKEEGSPPVSAITERRDMGLYEVPFSISLLGFGMGTMLANFHMCGIMWVL